MISGIEKEIKEFITFGSFDNREFGMMLMDRNAPIPTEKEVKESIPFMQGLYDFSMILGERFFDNRSITYTFQLIEKSYIKRKFVQSSFENELMRMGIVQLRDTYTPGYYFLGKCINVNTKDDHIYRRLLIEISFECHPFKIAELSEGHDKWDDFNFELDYSQDVTTSFIRSGYVDVPVGSYATLGAWATNTVHGPAILKQRIGASYKVLSKHVVDLSLSYHAYTLEGIEGMVYEQDIVQAFANLTEFKIINNGIASVAPIVDVNAGVSIIKNNVIYNFQKGKISDDVFRLDIGENNLKIVSLAPSTISFDFHKELI